MNRSLRVLYWLAPIAFCIAIYWLGMRIWFAQDDFAWLGLRNHVVDFRSFLWAMFAPLAQGSIRPWSERAFFMTFSYFFGLRALPYRLFVFANQFLNIVLVMMVVRKLTKSDLAGFVAAIFWIACYALVIPMAWTSAYNEIQCATFLLVSFYLFLLYTETDDRRFYWAQWVTFVLGFGSLEINVVYPAIAASYALLLARRYWRSTVPMFAASIVYAAIHRIFSSQPKNFYYDMDFHPAALMRTFGKYWKILLGVPEYGLANNWPHWLVSAAIAVLTAAIAGFVVWQARKRQFLPLFLLLWFLIILAPLLSLHNHVTDYYVTIPAIGLAMLGGYGVSLAWKHGPAAAILTGAVALLYLVPSTIVSHAAMPGFFDRADRSRALIQSVAYAKHIHPGKIILLKGIDNDMFWAVIYDSPFRIFGWNDIFLTPDSRPAIEEDPNLIQIDPYFLPQRAALRALNDGSAVVYTPENRQLRNITRGYTTFLNSQPDAALAREIDVGQPYFKDQVGEGWYGIEGGYRWSARHAIVYLPGPSGAGQKLYIHGFAPEQQFKAGPLHIALTVNGEPLTVKTINGSNAEFHFEYAMPDDLEGKPKVEVAFTLDRTIRVPTDDRDLGVTFGEFSVR